MVKTILVVDDSAVLRNLMTEVLQGAGYQVLQASRASGATAAIREQHVDLLVLDIGMPEMDGLTMLRHLRSMEEGRALPVILLTSDDERETVIKGSTLGICDYLLKSTFSLSYLLTRIEHHLGPAKSRSQLMLPPGAAVALPREAGKIPQGGTGGIKARTAQPSAPFVEIVEK